MNYTISIDHENKLINYQHKGIINKFDIGSAWVRLLSLKEFTQKKYNLFSDFREAKFDISEAEVYEICDFLFKIKHIVENKKQALIIEEPLSTALSYIFVGEVVRKVGFMVKVFSTERAAIQFLTD